MSDPAESASSDLAPNGFRVSDRPQVTDHRPERETAERLPASYGTDLLYVVARDPASLFVYWDLNWRRAFETAGISPRSIYLRTYRKDDSIEGTQQINPFRGHCYVEVSRAGTSYYCELGCFDHDTWYPLARSAATMTPESEMSEDLSATFATLPVHLSFQRLLDIFENTKKDSGALAHSVAELQAEARGGTETETNSSPDLAELLESARQVPEEGWSDVQRKIWRELTERLAESGPGGASEHYLGGSSLT